MLVPFALLLLPASFCQAQAPGAAGLDLLCPLMEHERQRVLDDFRLDLALVENEYQARKTIFQMVEQLWAVRSIEKEVYLDYQRLRDRTKVRVERVGAQIEQQRSIVEQYTLACGRAPAGTASEEVEARIEALNAQYRRIDCELLDRDVEIAEIDHAYHAAVLEATRTLAANSVKTKFDLVNDEYDLDQSKARVDGFRRRARNCRKRLETLGDG